LIGTHVRCATTTRQGLALTLLARVVRGAHIIATTAIVRVTRHVGTLTIAASRLVTGASYTHSRHTDATIRTYLTAAPTIVRVGLEVSTLTAAEIRRTPGTACCAIALLAGLVSRACTSTRAAVVRICLRIDAQTVTHCRRTATTTRTLTLLTCLTGATNYTAFAAVGRIG
jgi:hypothetical protein